MVPSFTTICRRRSRCLPARPSPLQALPPPSTPNQRHLCPHRTVTACRLRPQHRGTPPPASRTCSSLPPPPPRPHRRIRRGAPPICRRSNSSNAQLRRIRPRVNAANERMLGGGGVDGAIHRAAGPELVQAYRKVPEVKPGVRCPTGEARTTLAFKLLVSRVIHTVGPIYDVDKRPEVLLKKAYENSLKLAKENDIQYIAYFLLYLVVFCGMCQVSVFIALPTSSQGSNENSYFNCKTVLEGY